MERRISTAQIKEYGLQAGADLVGIAAVESFTAALAGFRPVDLLPGCSAVIVLAKAMPIGVLRDNKAYTEARNAMLTGMTALAKELTKYLKKQGYSTKAISSSGGKYLDGRLYGHISLKHAAELAGLGSINRNYLLTNPVYGNRLWFSGVLCDAELEADKPVSYRVCDNCNKCVEICPASALADQAVFEPKKCDKTAYSLAGGKFEVKCYACRLICPYGLGNEAKT